VAKKHWWCIRIWLYINPSVNQLTATHSYCSGHRRHQWQQWGTWAIPGLFHVRGCWSPSCPCSIYIFFFFWKWIHTWTWEFLYHEPLTNNRNGNTTHNNTENVPELLCHLNKLKFGFNNSVPEHYVQACILYTILSCQTLMSWYRAHKSQHPLKISNSLHGSGTSVYQSIRMVSTLLHGTKVVGLVEILMSIAQKRKMCRHQGPLWLLTLKNLASYI
jgi:hypothetical protein